MAGDAAESMATRPSAAVVAVRPSAFSRPLGGGGGEATILADTQAMAADAAEAASEGEAPEEGAEAAKEARRWGQRRQRR